MNVITAYGFVGSRNRRLGLRRHDLSLVFMFFLFPGESEDQDFKL